MGDSFNEGQADDLMYNSAGVPMTPEPQSATHLVILSTMAFISFTAGTIGNGLVILAVVLSKMLRSATNAFVVSLSVADLLTSLVVPVHAVGRSLVGTNDMNVKKLADSLVMQTQAIFNETVGCSILTLSCIGLNRLLLITRYATSYRAVCMPRKVAMWLVLTWLIPFPFTILLMFDQSHEAVVLAGSVYPIPLISILISYILIWRHLRRHTKRAFGSSEEAGESTSSNLPMVPQSVSLNNNPHPHSPAGAGTAVASSTQLSRRQTQITKNMFYVVCAFTVCMTPYVVCLHIDNKLALDYAIAFLLMNSCVNPMIYARKHRDFRTVFSCILRRQWDKIPEPSDALKAMRRN